MGRDKHKMKVHSRNTKVVAESDGGLIIYPKPGRDCHYPVLIIEATPFVTLNTEISPNG